MERRAAQARQLDLLQPATEPSTVLGGEHANGNHCQDVIYPGDRMAEAIH